MYKFLPRLYYSHDYAEKQLLCEHFDTHILSNIYVKCNMHKYINTKLSLGGMFLAMEVIGIQRPKIKKIKHTINTLSIRSGMTDGFMMTISKQQHTNFLYRLYQIGLPQNKDISLLYVKTVKHNNNQYSTISFGIKFFYLFPEIAAVYTGMLPPKIFGFTVNITYISKKCSLTPKIITSSHNIKTYLSRTQFPLYINRITYTKK